MINTIGKYWGGATSVGFERDSFSSGNSFRDSLKAYYKFDNNLLDISGNSLHLTGSADYFSDGVNTGFLSDDASGTYDNGGAFYIGSNPVTISCWIKAPETIIPDMGSDFYYGLSSILNIYIACTVNGYSIEYSMGTYSSFWSVGIHNRNELLLGKWNHIVITWDTNLVKKYINGNLIESNRISGYGAQNYDFDLMQINFPSFYATMMVIDELAFWKRCLTTGEISTIYKNRILFNG